MILDFFDGKLDGDSWEDICQSCYRIRYQEHHYTEIPAVQGVYYTENEAALF